MKKYNLALVFFLFSGLEVQVQAAEKEAVVIEVRKTISMSKNDKVYKNYFINGGGNLGLKKGVVVDVLRRLPLHDPLKNISVGDLRIKVGEIEIIHHDQYLSVGKLLSQESPESRPVLDYEAIMVGDRLDLASIKAPKAPSIPDVNAAFIPSETSPEKVALLASSDKAKSLLKEGEQQIEALSRLKTEATSDLQIKGQRQLASLAKPQANSLRKKAKANKSPKK
jgi:hypothetical protein